MWCAALVSGVLLQATAPQAVGAEAAPGAPAVPAAPAAPEIWTFERVREKVLEQGIGVQEARFRLQRASLGLEDARNAFFPAISVTGGVLAGTLEGRDPVDLYLGVKASPILEGYDKFFARQLAALEVRAGRLAETEAREQLLSRARQSYLSLLATAEARKHLTTAVNHAQRLVDAAGVESEPDLAAVRQLEASLVLQRERMSLRALDERRGQEELGLKTLLGLGPDEPFGIDTETAPASVLPAAEAGPGAAEAGPAPAALQDTRASLGLEVAQRRQRLARFASLPQPSLRVGLSRGGFELRSGAYVFAGVDIPLFDWGQRKRLRARAAVEVAEKERELKRATLERGAELARSELRRAALEQRREDLLQYLELAERRLQAQLTLYKNGRIAAADLARTQLEIARERAELALNEGAVWGALCQREALLRVGVVSAP